MHPTGPHLLKSYLIAFPYLIENQKYYFFENITSIRFIKCKKFSRYVVFRALLLTLRHIEQLAFQRVAESRSATIHMASRTGDIGTRGPRQELPPGSETGGSSLWSTPGGVFCKGALKGRWIISTDIMIANRVQTCPYGHAHRSYVLLCIRLIRYGLVASVPSARNFGYELIDLPFGCLLFP